MAVPQGWSLRALAQDQKIRGADFRASCDADGDMTDDDEDEDIVGFSQPPRALETKSLR